MKGGGGGLQCRSSTSTYICAAGCASTPSPSRVRGNIINSAYQRGKMPRNTPGQQIAAEPPHSLGLGRAMELVLVIRNRSRLSVDIELLIYKIILQPIWLIWRSLWSPLQAQTWWSGRQSVTGTKKSETFLSGEPFKKNNPLQSHISPHCTNLSYLLHNMSTYEEKSKLHGYNINEKPVHTEKCEKEFTN